MSEPKASEVEVAEEFFEAYSSIKKEVSKIIIGQDAVVDLLFLSIFCNGHSLLIGVPGLAKTLLVNTVSRVLDLSFNRIQFTPDLMPSDILGSETLDKERNFKFIKGAIFANIVLADEINRTPPKTQAALLEAMQEKKVTVAGKDYHLDAPFYVLATQNPIEQEGTYPLPEAQLDRFMFSIELDYPSLDSELDIVKSTTADNEVKVSKILSKEQIISFQKLVRKVPVPDNVLEYAVNLARKTRPMHSDNSVSSEFLDWGAGPRASQYLVIGAKCHALVKGKYSPDIEDVQAIAKPVLRHRIVRNFKAEAEGYSANDIIEKLL
ncbi:MAG: MoxR family ATPase [Bacteroidota bacterium]